MQTATEPMSYTNSPAKNAMQATLALPNVSYTKGLENIALKNHLWSTNTKHHATALDG
jgi:hypothetical protein